MTRHFLTLTDLTPDELGYLIQRAIELKTMLRNGQHHEPLQGKTLGMILAKSSHRRGDCCEVGRGPFGGSRSTRSRPEPARPSHDLRYIQDQRRLSLRRLCPKSSDGLAVDGRGV